MPDFEINSEDFSNSKTLTSKIADNFYPNGEVVIKNTTLSRAPIKDRKLRSADPIRILQGDDVYRNPAMATAAYVHTAQSALHGVIASRADIGDIKIPDPNDPTGKGFLSGAEARNELIRKSSISTGLAPSGFESSISALNQSVMSRSMSGGTNSVVMTNPDGSTYSHLNGAYPAADGMPVLNGYNRDLAIKSQMDEQERAVYDAKIKEIKDKINFDGDLDVFTVNLSQLSSFNFDVRQSGTYFGGERNTPTNVSQEYKSLNAQVCYPAAALLELVVQLTNKIYILGNKGTSRGFVGADGDTLTAKENILSDHTFGRGLDIFQVGHKKESSFNLSTKNISTYREGLGILLTTISALPQELHPDLIIIHSGLKKEMGIESGLEDVSSAIRLQYPGISPRTNFHANENHDNHIHISFSSKRGGSFVVPSTVSSSVEAGGGGTVKIFNPKEDFGFDIFKVALPPSKFPNFQLSQDAVMDLMLATNLYSDEVAAIFVGIARRESNFRPAAINGNRATKDFSLGLFQVNFLPGAHGSKSFLLKYPSEQTVLGYKLAYSIDNDMNPFSLALKVQSLANLSTVDYRMFIPFNQAISVGITATNYDHVIKKLKNNQKFDNYIFGPWGDYKGGPGFIFRVNFNRIAQVYTAKGKNIETLKNWIRTKFKNARPYPYIERWMEGTMFNTDGSVFEG